MPPTRTANQPWHSSLTVDVLLRLLKNSIFQPFICWLIPLCLRAGETPYTAPVMKNTVAWAIFITVLTLILAPLNDKLAYGKPREIDHEEEVIVITGGASGLGRCMAEIWALKGATVAVLDVKGENDEVAVEGVNYYQCDISDAAAVEKCWAKINEELGLPTVLINNAGVAHSAAMLDMTAAEISSTFQINTLPHFALTRLFLPPLLTRSAGGTVVTISSVLAHLGAAHYSAYTASKASLHAMHASLAAELSPHPAIKTILVAPGQLSTEMFAGLEQGPVANFFGPIVEVSGLAVKVVNMVCEGRGGVIAEPAYARWIGVLGLLPDGLQKILRQAAGVDKAMRTRGNAVRDGDEKALLR